MDNSLKDLCHSLKLLEGNSNDNSIGLTTEEQTILNHLIDAYNEFISLPEQHPQDNDEFTQHIHILQRQVMSRLARRVHPELFGN